MSKKIKIEIIVPSDAQYRFGSPYMKHDAFIKYCNANNVYVSEAALEIYEKNRLLFPCVRLVYPRELLRRRYRVKKPGHRNNPKIRDEWIPLIELEKCERYCRLADQDAYHDMVENGHPYDRALKDENPFVLNPKDKKFKVWKRYNVIVGKYGKDNRNRCKSKAEHYYAPWKIFMVQELNLINTDEHNRVPGTRRGRGSLDKKLLRSVLGEFTPFFNTITSFRCRYNILIASLHESAGKKRIKWGEVQRRTKSFSKELFLSQCYENWIRFLRKLIELHESYLEDEKYLLSLEVKSYMASTVAFLGYSKGSKYKFEKICKDVSGRFDKRLGSGYVQGVIIYPGRLEEIFADEEYDLESNVRWVFSEDFKRFNNLLGEEEKLKESLADELFDELKEGHTKVILAIIGKINRVLNDEGALWRDYEFWSSILDLAVHVETLGKEWLGGNDLGGVFQKAFSKEYPRFSRNQTNAKTSQDYIRKLDLLRKNNEVPVDKKCGKHLDLARLTRNFAAHSRGLSDNDLHDNLTLIYNALVSTLFVLYDSYKLQNTNKN